jgi:hypothetical protein
MSRAIVSDVAGRFPLERTADAYRAMDAGAPGKILVRPQERYEADGRRRVCAR